MAEAIAKDLAVYETAKHASQPGWVGGWFGPVPSWIVYLAPALILLLPRSSGGGAAAVTRQQLMRRGNKGLVSSNSDLYLPFHAVPELVAFYTLALMHWTTLQHALDTHRPAMRADRSAFRNLTYPALPIFPRPTLMAKRGGRDIRHRRADLLFRRA